jgi:tetratricopeptide (TPR) repeat protein
MRNYLTAPCFCLPGALLALACSLSACQSAPPPGDLYLRDAHLARQAGQTEEARTFAELAVEDGRHEREARELLALIHRQEGRSAAEHGDHRRAHAFFSSAAEAELDRVRRARDLHSALEAADQIPLGQDEILELILLILQDDPQNASLHRRAAHLFEDLGEEERAATYYVWLVAADPDDMRSTFRLGVIYLALGRYRESAAMLQRVYAANPRNLPAAMNLVAALQHLERHEDVGALFDELLQLFPEQPMLLSRYADFEESQGRTERAASLRHQAVEASPAIEEREEMRPLR